jgi:hypothetical protein
VSASADSTPAATRRDGSLLPREHGAWGQLALPLVTGLALGRPGAAALLLATAAVFAFLAHEPLLVVLGHRGARVEAELGRRARRAPVVRIAAAAAAGAGGLALAPPAALIPSLVAAGLFVGAAQLAFFRLERTTAGELVVASALAVCAAPVALAAGAPPHWAAAAVVTWITAFAAATLPVRAILLRARTKGAVDRRPLAAAGVTALVGAGLWSGSHAWIPWTAALAPLPVAALALALTAVPIRPQRLTAVGWSIASASVATLLLLVLGLRLG